MSVLGANSLGVLNNLDSGNCVVCRKALNSILFHRDNFQLGCNLIYQSRLGVGHIQNLGFGGGKSSLEIRNLTVQAIKLFTNVLQNGSMLTYLLREGFVLLKLGVHIVLSSFLYFYQFLIAR